MKKFVTIAVVLTLMVAMLLGTGIAYADDWPMFHHDLSLSGVSLSDAPITNATAWTYDTGADVEASPAVADGVLYVGNVAGDFYALDASSGAFIWSTSLGGSIHSSAAVANDIVYVLDEDGELNALNASDGSAVTGWPVLIGDGAWDWSSPAVHNGNVFVATSDGYLHSLNALTGAPNWSTIIGAQPNSMIAVANGKVYSGTHNFDNSAPTLVVLNEGDGSVAWTYDYYLYHSGVTGMINCNGVSVADGDSDGDLDVYFGVYNWDGVGPQAICLDEATGTENWAVSVGGNSTSTPAVHDGQIFIGSDDNQVYALDAVDGSVNWTYATGDYVWAAPAVADGMVFIGSLDHTFYALDELTGALVWSYYTGTSRLISSPAIADGMVFVGNENGNVYAFSALTIDKVLVDAYELDGGNGDGILDPYEDWEFVMEITVTNNTDGTLEDILVKDNFGGDLEMVSINGETVATPANKKQVWTGSGAADGVTVLWTGKTLKAHMDWMIPSLDDGESITLTVVVSTDVNPGQQKDGHGKNEYTSEGTHILNSGPTATVMMSDEEVIVSDSREITVTTGTNPM